MGSRSCDLMGCMRWVLHSLSVRLLHRLQECWRSDVKKGVGLFLHSPLLDELKAIQVGRGVSTRSRGVLPLFFKRAFYISVIIWELAHYISLNYVGAVVGAWFLSQIVYRAGSAPAVAGE